MRRAMIYPDNYPPEKTNTGTLYDTPVTPDSNVSRNPSLAMSQRGVTYGAPLGPPPLYTQRETNEYNRANQHGQSLQMTASASTSRPPSGAASPGMKSKFMGNTASDMFESLPPCFSRSPPYHELMAAPFPTFSLISIDSNLDKGFPAVIPPSPCQPHPFIVHDVHEEDWTRLLNDVKVVSKLSGRDKVVSNVVPMLSGAGLVGGLFLTRAIEKGMKKKKVAIVADIIDHWNLHFFHPRLMRITLAQGRVVHAGEPGPPPDMPNLHSLSDHNEQNTYINTTEQVSDSDSSSSSSSEDEDARHGSRHEHDGSYDSKEARKREKRQRKQERKELKQERKRDKKQKRNEWKQEKDERRYARRRRKQAIKDASGEKWRLIVSFRPPSV